MLIGTVFAMKCYTRHHRLRYYLMIFVKFWETSLSLYSSSPNYSRYFPMIRRRVLFALSNWASSMLGKSLRALSMMMRGITNLMYYFLSFGQQRVAFIISLAKSSPSFWKKSIYKLKKC